MKYFIENDHALEAKFSFRDFVQAWGFMSMVALKAERLNHHPEWKNIYNQVEIRLQTHSAGNIVTDLDIKLAQEIEALYESLKTA